MATRSIGTCHPVLTTARLTSDLAALPRRRRERDYIKVAHGLWLPRGHPTDLESMSVAFTKLYPDSVLTGWSAASLHGISAPDGAVPELCVGAVGRKRAGVRIRRYPLSESNIRESRGVRFTIRDQTVFDLARFNDRVEAVLAVEAFYRQGLTQDCFMNVVEDRRGTWGISRARRALADAHPKSESPRETETRLALQDAGFTSFVPQLEVRDLGYRLDLADPVTKIAVEYDGHYHADPGQLSRDRIRRNRLQAAGWIIIVVDYSLFRRHRETLLQQVRAAYARRAFEAEA